MNFEPVKRNSAYKKFVSDTRKGKLNHAYIFYSEDDALRETFLTLAVMNVHCKHGACGECETCRQIMEGVYPEHIKLDAKDKISVKDIEGLIESVSIKCVVGDRKTVVIDNAELLTPQVQNKLLKTYEEPPDYLTIFLGAKHENGLLSTIKSRGKKLYLEDLSAADVAKELTENGVDEETAFTAAAFSMGNYSKAEKFCSDEKYRETYEKTFEMMLNLKKSNQVPDYVYGGLFEADTIKITLDFMEIILCDVLKIVTKSKLPLFTVDREYDVKKIAEGFTAESAAAAIEQLNTARAYLASNVNATATAGKTLLGILEEKYTWRKK